MFLSGIIDELEGFSKSTSWGNAMFKKMKACVLLLLLLACDPEGKKDCAWVLEPEPKLKGKTDEGYIPVCARNRNTMKQDCRFQATLDYAEQVFGKKFRYDDIDFDSVRIPRTIKKIKFCSK